MVDVFVTEGDPVPNIKIFIFKDLQCLNSGLVVVTITFNPESHRFSWS